jgi:cohesin loading factor subunit SCC2
VFEILMYFTEHEDEDIRHKALTGIGFLCIRYYYFMLETRLKECYKYLLVESPSIKLKCQTLRNLEMYLVEEEIKMIKADHECKIIVRFWASSNLDVVSVSSRIVQLGLGVICAKTMKVILWKMLDALF